ncbi:MAG: hypothetical protein WC466_06295 [Candidatus Izemoplasmatales bacterium]
MEKIRIKKTDVIFDEKGDGKGKIIISDDKYGYNFSYYWGSMGKATTLKEFVRQIDTNYFVDKLSNRKTGNLDIRKTFVNLRKYIKSSIQYDLQWYEHTEFQKDFRKKLRSLQNDSFSVKKPDDFIITNILSFHSVLNYDLILVESERDKIKLLFSSIFENSDPWLNFVYFQHAEELFLEKLHKQIKKSLKKPVQLCLF